MQSSDWTTTYVDTKLVNGTPYSYKVTTRYQAAESLRSKVLSATPGNPGQGPKKDTNKDKPQR